MLFHDKQIKELKLIYSEPAFGNFTLEFFSSLKGAKISDTKIPGGPPKTINVDDEGIVSLFNKNFPTPNQAENTLDEVGIIYTSRDNIKNRNTEVFPQGEKYSLHSKTERPDYV